MPADPRFWKLVDDCMTGDFAAVRHALETGVNQNTDPGQPRGWSPVMTASYYGHLDIVKYLVEKGASLGWVEVDRWWTAVDLADYAGHKDIVRYLVAKGARRGGSRPVGK